MVSCSKWRTVSADVWTTFASMKWAGNRHVDVRTEPRHREFACVWFEGGWLVLFPNGKTLDGFYPSSGAATNAALEELGAAEADFDCVANTGEFLRFEECRND